MKKRDRDKAGKNLGEILIEGAFITAAELQFAQETAQRTGEKLTEVLVKEKIVTPETLATILSFHYDVPIVDLKKFEIQPQALTAISETVAREDHVLPLSVNGDTLTVAMEDPGNQELIDKLSALSHKRISPVIPLHGSLRFFTDSNYRLVT